MSSTTRSPATRWLPPHPPNRSGKRSDRPSAISEHEPLPGFGCLASIDRPGVTRISLTGELDIATSPRLGAVLSRPRDDTALVILDLRQVTFIDATGLAVILNADHRLRATGSHLVLIPGPRGVQRLFELTGTQRQLDFLTTPAINPSSTSIGPATSRAAFH